MDGRSPCGRCDLGGNAFPGLYRFNASARSAHSREAYQDIEDVGPPGQRLGCPGSRRHDSGSSLRSTGVLLGALWHSSRAASLSKLQFPVTAIHSGKLLHDVRALSKDSYFTSILNQQRRRSCSSSRLVCQTNLLRNYANPRRAPSF